MVRTETIFPLQVFLFVNSRRFAGFIEIIPDFWQGSQPTVGKKPHTVLELAGKTSL